MENINLAIIGSGPSGYTAGVYASRAKLDPTLFAGIQSGGQLMWTTDVENYPGFTDGVDGKQLMAQMRGQAERFGTKIIDTYVTAVDFSQRPFKIWTQLPETNDPVSLMERTKPEELLSQLQSIKEQEPTHLAKAVIISTGAVSRMLGVAGERELLGKGVSTCAVCDAAFYKDKDTFVVGGGDSAMEDTLALTKFAKSVTIIHRKKEFRASKIMQERVLNHEKVKVLWETELVRVIGEEKVEHIEVRNSKSEILKLDAQGVFLAIGHIPMTTIFKDQLDLDSHNYVLTRHSFSKRGAEMALEHSNEAGLIQFPSMTSVEGVFAAGDVVDLRYKQAITAAGQGCQAALDAERWLEQ